MIEAWKEILKLMIENHPLDCLTCEKSGSCTLQDLCYEYDIKEGGLQLGKEELSSLMTAILSSLMI